VEQFSWDDVPHEEVSPMISRQAIHTPYITMARIDFKRGGSAPSHHHANDQVTTVVSGKLQLEIEGVKLTLIPGNVVRVPGNVPHAAEALEDTIVLDVFTPPRADWQ
jgi:quercetin dioxygenase-like cupin family protein